MTDLHWRFRAANPDGGRDFGNANIWAFDPTLDVFTREVCQNTLDVRVGPRVNVAFDLYRLAGVRLQEFLVGIGWPELEGHLRGSADPEQKFGRTLKQGLDHLDDHGEMVVLRIQETHAAGLLGAERGVKSNFAALCRNNLDSNKGSTAGGAFGLGKAVLWRCSSLSTVLFHSDLSEALEGNTARQHGRLFGRCELAWHQSNDSEYAGPGWFGADDPDGQAVSAWNARSAAESMLLGRPPGSTGTSILVVGFDDPSREGQESVDDMADHLSGALSTHFWPAIDGGLMDADVGYWADGPDGPRTRVPVDLHSAVGPFTDLAKKMEDADLRLDLAETGAVVHRVTRLGIPKRRDGVHGDLVHHPDLIVRRADAHTEKENVNRVALVRGPGMVVQYWNLPNLRIGARPFHAVLRCGEAAATNEARVEAEQFLRIAEPPSHDEWKVTPDMGALYKVGGGARLDELREQVRKVLRELVAPVASDATDGPEALKRLLTIKVPAERTGEPRVTNVSGDVSGELWTLALTVTAKPIDGHIWSFVPTARTAVEGGTRALLWVQTMTGPHNCSIEDNRRVRMHPGRHQCRFTITVDPDSMPGAAADLALELAVVERELLRTP